jgi:hypothetical protein
VGTDPETRPLATARNGRLARAGTNPRFPAAVGTLRPLAALGFRGFFPTVPTVADPRPRQFSGKSTPSPAGFGLQPISPARFDAFSNSEPNPCGDTMNTTAERMDRPSLETAGTHYPSNPEPPGFEFPNEEEREVFEDICDFIAERAAILEYEAGFTPETAEAEAERLAMDRYPPSPTARASILANADRIAAHFGFPEWRASGRLSELQIQRLHVDHYYWFSLRNYFKGQKPSA